MLVALGRLVRSPTALRQEAPGFLEEMLETLIAAVYGLSSASQGGLDVLTREEFRGPPVRGLLFFFGHDGWSLSDALGSCAGFVAAPPARSEPVGSRRARRPPGSASRPTKRTLS
jgi:hypothetical protein